MKVAGSLVFWPVAKFPKHDISITKKNLTLTTTATSHLKISIGGTWVDFYYEEVTQNVMSLSVTLTLANIVFFKNLS